jgi:hypothetical protein
MPCEQHAPVPLASIDFRRCSKWFAKQRVKRNALTAVLLLLSATAVRAQCVLTETRRKFEGAEHTVVHMENERIVVEVVPELEGRIIKYADKTRPASGFEWLDDCPYHYGGRWEGVPFQYHVNSKGPKQASLTVSGGGKIAVALLHRLVGADLASPVDLKVERTMSIEPNSSRLKIDVKVTNSGDGVAPTFRYMVHAVIGQVPPMPGGRAFWFLPTNRGVEFFDSARGDREMGTSAGLGGAPLDSPFSRFTPGHKADKPRYEAGGWGAVLTSAGPLYIFYDPGHFDFMQYWFGGDAEWHFTFEPHTKPVDLKPGQSVACSFSLAYDSHDVPFVGPTIAYETPNVADVLLPDSPLKIHTRATTVRDRNEQAQLKLELIDSQQRAIVSTPLAGEVQPFKFTDLAAEIKLPAGSKLGAYTWKMTTGENRELASGKFEIITAAEQANRQTAKATAALQAQIDVLKQQLGKQENENRRLTDLWRAGMDLALTWNDARFWPDHPPATGAVAVSIDPASVPVLGDWQSKEAARIKSLAAIEPNPWPTGAEKMLAALGADRALVRDVAADADGKGLVALMVDSARGRTEIVRLGANGNAGGIAKRFGEFSDKPGETDAKLGSGARAIVVDNAGNIWVATNAWGKTSVFRINQDGSPYEEAVIAAKGAVKKFSPTGDLLGTISLLAPPTDLALAKADGVPVVIASYRQVSAYHGAQVREGVLLVRMADALRFGEIKIPGGSVAIDSTGRLWSADVAGHVACYDARGRKQFDLKETPAAAVPDAVLPANSPLPVVLRANANGGIWLLSTLRRTLGKAAGTGAAVELTDIQAIPPTAGPLWRLTGTAAAPLVIGEKSLWRRN